MVSADLLAHNPAGIKRTDNGWSFTSASGISVVRSDRGFETFTGTVAGVPVSVVATGMGLAMMDFMVREVRHVVEGPMLMVRFGTSGGLGHSIVPGSVVVAHPGASLVLRDYEAVDRGAGRAAAAYRFLPIVQSDSPLSLAVEGELRAALPIGAVVQGVNVTADSFYASQGRTSSAFSDQNAELLDEVLVRYPSALCMEMETYQLLHLAKHSGGSIRAASAAIVVRSASLPGPHCNHHLANAPQVANRMTGAVLTHDEMRRVEALGGMAVMRAVASSPLQ